MKTALVIGSSGFVGRHVCPLLEAAGYRVERVDTALGESIEEWLQSGRWLTLKPFDLVVHLAARIESIADRATSGIRAFEDIATDLCVARYLEERPPRECAVWMSSCATDTAFDADGDPYSLVKYVGERLALTLHRKGIPIVILRPYSGYGADQAKSYPFPAIIERAMRREDPLVVWGSGDQIRDFIHIDDLADAIVHGILHFPRGVPIPIGTGFGTNLNALALHCAEAVGYDPAIVNDRTKPQGGKSRVADWRLADIHGWKSTITLEEGIRRNIEQTGREK